MSIRAIMKDGQIQPVEPVPADWAEGRELTIEAEEPIPTKEELDAWEARMQAGALRIPDEEHERFLKGLEEVEAASKLAIRREWGLE